MTDVEAFRGYLLTPTPAQQYNQIRTHTPDTLRAIIWHARPIMLDNVFCECKRSKSAPIYIRHNRLRDHLVKLHGIENIFPTGTNQNYFQIHDCIDRSLAHMKHIAHQSRYGNKWSKPPNPANNGDGEQIGVAATKTTSVREWWLLFASAPDLYSCRAQTHALLAPSRLPAFHLKCPAFLLEFPVGKNALYALCSASSRTQTTRQPPSSARQS